jgi:hypothetical protein
VTQPNPRLIADLARLASKYPPEDWVALLDFLRDSERQAGLAFLVEQLASASERRPPARSKTEHQSSVRHELALVREQDPAKAELLDDVWSRLRQRQLLPDMKAVRAFAEVIGLKGLSATKRDQAISEVMRHILHMPATDLVAALKQAGSVDPGLGEEYGRWVRIILGQTNPPSDLAT